MAIGHTEGLDGLEVEGLEVKGLEVEGLEGLNILPLPLREGVGGGGETYPAWPPPPYPLPQGEGEDIQSLHRLPGAHFPHGFQSPRRLHILHNPHADSIDP